MFSKYKDYIIVALLLLTSRETLLFGTNSNETMILLGYIAPLVVLLLLHINKSNKNISSEYKRRSLGWLSTLVVLTALLNFDLNVKYGYEFLIIFIAYLLTENITFGKFKTVYTNIILLLSLYGVLTGVVFLIYPSIIESFPVINNKGGLQYFNMFLAVIPCAVYGDIYRLYSIFREPGVAIIFINIALIFELYLSEQIKWKRTVVLLAAIVLSFSTAGYIVTALILLTYFLGKNRVGTIYKLMTFISIITLSVFILSNDFVNQAVFSKFGNENSSSTAARFGSVYNNLQLVINNPLGVIYGLGYQYVEDAFVSIGNLRYGEGHNTNTILKFLSVHGVFYVTYLIARFYKFFKLNFSEQNSLQILILWLTLIVSLGNEDLTINVIVYILIFYSYKKHNSLSYEKI